MSNYKPKLSIELTPAQHKGLQDIDLPHGFMRALFSNIVDDILDLNASKGPQAIALIVAGAVKSTEVLPSCASVDKFYPKEKN